MGDHRRKSSRLAGDTSEETESIIARRRSTRLVDSTRTTSPATERTLRNRQPNNYCEDGEIGEDSKELRDASPKEGFLCRRKNGSKKENVWKDSPTYASPLKLGSLSGGTEVMGMLPKIATTPVVSNMQLSTPTKTSRSNFCLSELPDTPRSNRRVVGRKHVQDVEPMEVEGDEAKVATRKAETPKSRCGGSEWKSMLVEATGSTPKLKLHRLGSELELGSQVKNVKSPAASHFFIGTPDNRSRLKRGAGPLSSKKSVRKLDLDELSPIEESTSSQTPRRSTRKTKNVSYGAFLDVPSTTDSSSEAEDSKSEPDSSSEEDSSDSESETKMSKSCSTPVRKIGVNQINASALCTPKMKQVLTNSTADYSPRRTPNIDRLKHTPKSESYFTAEKRMKFGTPQSVRKAEQMLKVKEAKSGSKKPRKGNRQGIDKAGRKIPMLPPSFSVSKECKKIPLDVERGNPWYEQHEEALDKLHKEICNDFPRWMLYLKEGFNIMLHGYGSKKPILDAFSDSLENKFPLVVVNGLFSKFNARKFVIDFAHSIEGDEEVRIKPSTINFMTEELLAKTTNKHITPYFIFVLNFDMLAVRHPQMLSALSGLARLPFVHVIASSDHINAGLGISPNDNVRLNFVWIDCTTFFEYSNELVWYGDFFGNAGDGGGGKNSLEHIFKSLTANAKKAFGLLAGLQVRSKKAKSKTKTFNGIEFRELLRVCRESFVAHSELVLKSLLTEFVDHKIIHYSGKGKHDDNFLMVDLDDETLEKYAENV